MVHEKWGKHRKNKAWLKAVAEIEVCVLCGSGSDLQVAHSNEHSKGMGIKAPDCLTARLCRHCHHEIDNGADLCRETRRSLMNRAIVKTLEILVKRGLVCISK